MHGMNDFQPIRLEDKSVFDDFFSEDPPQCSEYTFTNLFMWKEHHRPTWRVWKDCLLVVFCPSDDVHFGLQPIGKGDKRAALDFLADHVHTLTDNVQVCRVTKGFVDEHVSSAGYDVVEDPDNSDYVYVARELAELPGNKFHKKKNHVNKFVKNNEFDYRPLDPELVDLCLDLQEDWCELRECVLNPALFDENMAVYEALKNYQQLGFVGGAILIDSKVEAFAFGEKLNPDTAVIHVEKANTKIQGLYAAINQRFCQAEWTDVTYINREQDLGQEGLRKAKESYHPHHMVDKYILTRRR
jgi:hypothetical protein